MAVTRGLRAAGTTGERFRFLEFGNNPAGRLDDVDPMRGYALIIRLVTTRAGHVCRA